MPQPYKIKLRITYPRILMQTYRIREAIARIMMEEVQSAVVTARNLAPVRTGRMRDSIQISEWIPERHYIRAGVYAVNEQGVHYPIFVEFGTSKMHARPFWRPPIWEAFYRMRERIQQMIRTGNINV